MVGCVLVGLLALWRCVVALMWFCSGHTLTVARGVMLVIGDAGGGCGADGGLGVVVWAGVVFVSCVALCGGRMLGVGVGWVRPRRWGVEGGVIVAKRLLFFDSTPIGRGDFGAALYGRSVVCLLSLCCLCLGGATQGIWRGPVPVPIGRGVKQR